MKSKSSLWVSGFLTLLVVGVVFGVSLLSQSLAQGGKPTAVQNSPTATPLPTSVSPVDGTSDVESYQQQVSDMETQYQTQLQSLKDNLRTQNEAYAAQLKTLTDQLAEAETTVTTLDEEAKTMQETVDQLQLAIQDEDLSYQSNMELMVSMAQEDELAMTAEIEGLYANLQMAYDEIYARQAVASASSSNSGNNNQGGGNNQSSHHDDDHGEEHDDD